MNQPVKRAVNDRMVIFNLDGCVSDDRWRRDRVAPNAQAPADFKAYHDGAVDDDILKYGAAILMNHIANGDFIVFCTGRALSYQEPTAKWIIKHFNIQPNDDFIICMREDVDQRPVVEVKKDHVNFLVNSFGPQKGKAVIAAYDNRRDVVEAYLAFGFDATLLNEDGEFLIPKPDKRLAAQSTGAITMPREPINNSHVVERVMHKSPLPSFDEQCASLKQSIESMNEQSGELDCAIEDPRANSADAIAELPNSQKYPKYFKDVRNIDEIDVYLLLEIFEVNSHALGHAIKKLLLPGSRTGGKSVEEDVKEARDTLNRWLEIRSKFA